MGTEENLEQIISLYNKTDSGRLSALPEAELSELAIRIRRELHRFPEVGWLTMRTTVLVAELLEQIGYQVTVGEEILPRKEAVDAPEQIQSEHQWKRCKSRLPDKWYEKWKTWVGNLGGVIASYDSGVPGETIAYRFDMDALPLQESQEPDHVPMQKGFASCLPGKFHGCGHDGHTAIGLCVARLFMEHRKMLKGKLIFIFQPAEEGVRGAKSYCTHWQFGKIDKLFCCHIGFAPEDTFVAGAGGFLATTKLDVEFTGKAAHAGLCPERGRNALLAAADAMLRMQEIPKPEGKTVRLNAGTLQGGQARNIIAAHAKMQMETRGEDTEINQYMCQQAKKILAASAEKYGVTYTVTEKGESDSADSSEEMSRHIMRVAQKQGNFSDYLLHKNFGASDDGAEFMHMVQQNGGEAAYVLLGTKQVGHHHEAKFDFSEDVLRKGSEVLFAAGMKYMD